MLMLRAHLVLGLYVTSIGPFVRGVWLYGCAREVQRVCVVMPGSGFRDWACVETGIRG